MQKSARAERSVFLANNRVEQRCAANVTDNERGTLDTIDCNEEFIKLTLAVLMAPE